MFRNFVSKDPILWIRELKLDVPGMHFAWPTTMIEK